MLDAALSPPDKLLPVDRILVRSTNWLGDAVMSTPALLRLREAYPKAHIVLLTAAKLEKLWLHHLAVDAVISFTPKDSVWRIGRELRRGKFDLALVLPNSPRSAFEVFWAGIPRRVGYARPWRGWLLSHQVPPWPGEVKMRQRPITEIRRLIGARPVTPPPPSFGAHHLFQYLHLVAAVGASPVPLAPELMLTETELEEAAPLLQTATDAPPFWLGLNPGAAFGPAKRWPEDRFVAAAAAVHQQTKCGCVVVGGANDVEAATGMMQQLQRAKVTPLINLASRTTLRQLCAVLKLCRVVLTNDSGPMHVAAAVGTPVVVPFGSTSPELTGPSLPGSPGHSLLSARVACAPCFRRQCPIDFRCMTRITVEQVVTAILHRVRASGG